MSTLEDMMRRQVREAMNQGHLLGIMQSAELLLDASQIKDMPEGHQAGLMVGAEMLRRMHEELGKKA